MLCGIQHDAHNKRMHCVHAEIDRKLQSRVTGGSINTLILGKRKDTKTDKSSRIQSCTELRLVHAKAAGSAAGSSEVDIFADDLFARDPGALLLLEKAD